MPFHPNIRPPRITASTAASTHAQAGFGISQPVSWNVRFCSTACFRYHERTYRAAGPPCWMSWAMWQQPGRRTKHRVLMFQYEQPLNRVPISKGQRRWWDLTVMMVSLCGAGTAYKFMHDSIFFTPLYLTVLLQNCHWAKTMITVRNYSVEINLNCFFFLQKQKPKYLSG